MLNIYLESVTNNDAVYGMDVYTEDRLGDEDMQAMHDGNDKYPLWDRLHAAVEARYPNSQVVVTTIDGKFKVIVYGA
jgi:hypothetical protein|tara:strand:- start:192 stop:422 length:231 start_codon:yes stop_codon:yes gene_type:complete